MAVIIGDLVLGNLWRSHVEIYRLLVSHTTRYPQMEIQDIYKLLYQGSMGSEHIVNSFEEFERDLIEEWDAVEANEDIPVWENIRPDGQLVRFYLAPHKARGGEIASLATLCFWSSSLFHGNTEDLKSGWDTIVKTCREKKFCNSTEEEIEEFDHWLRKYNFPPIHHTEAYRKSYNPAYRLLLRDFLNVLTRGKKT